MPTTKKRINLTVPDAVYERLQVYKKKNGFVNDASTCLALIIQQLNALENLETVMNLAQSLSMEQLTQLSKEGLALTKSLADSIDG